MQARAGPAAGVGGGHGRGHRDAPAERVQAWAESRRDRAEKSAARSVAKAEKAAADPEGAAKRAAQRAERIGNGLADLDRWLTDQIASGISDSAALSYSAVDPVAKRLVDAQAPGVAGRVRTLATARSSSGDAWPDAVLAEFARLHLLCQAWTRLAELPPAMQDTVRRRVGISVDADAVRRDGERVADRWHVLGARDRAADKLTERRIWLRGAESGRAAMLLAFGAAQQAPTLALPVGAVYRAEMAFHSEVLPLRAQMESGELETPSRRLRRRRDPAGRGRGVRRRPGRRPLAGGLAGGDRGRGPGPGRRTRRRRGPPRPADLRGRRPVAAARGLRRASR